jgi:hypothetical protein
MVDLTEIKCDLKEIPEHFFDPSSSKMKHGVYHGSNFWDIPKFGTKKWVVAVRINMDFSEFDGIEVSDTELAQACVNYLNKPPPRRKYAKRSPKPKYGNLELYKAKIVERNSEKYIDAHLIVQDRRCPHFWGKGRML